MNILMSLMMLSMVLTMIIMARASAERITEILNEESDLKNGSQPNEEVKAGSVVFENVSFSYLSPILVILKWGSLVWIKPYRT